MPLFYNDVALLPLTLVVPLLSHSLSSPCSTCISAMSLRRTEDNRQFNRGRYCLKPTLRLLPALSPASLWPQPPVVASLAMRAPGFYIKEVERVEVNIITWRPESSSTLPNFDWK